MAKAAISGSEFAITTGRELWDGGISERFNWPAAINRRRIPEGFESHPGVDRLANPYPLEDCLVFSPGRFAGNAEALQYSKTLLFSRSCEGHEKNAPGVRKRDYTRCGLVQNTLRQPLDRGGVPGTLETREKDRPKGYGNTGDDPSVPTHPLLTPCVPGRSGGWCRFSLQLPETAFSQPEERA